MTSRSYYNVKVVTDIIYNEPAHLVSVFKDYLIFDDVSEFLRRVYSIQEARERIPRMAEYFIDNCLIYPTYVALEKENKFMYKNIDRKARVIEEKQRYQIKV